MDDGLGKDKASVIFDDDEKLEAVKVDATQLRSIEEGLNEEMTLSGMLD